MSINKTEIWNLCEKVITENNYLLIDLVIRGNERQQILEVFVDGRESVTTDKCAEVSRILEAELENTDLLKPNYRLDVSSPGIDRPFKFFEQYHKNIGRKFKVSYKSGEENNNLEAKLVSAENDKLIFESGKEQIQIDFNNIIKAQVLISF